MIRVKATKMGFGGSPPHLIAPGEEFPVSSEKEVSKHWMVRLDPPKPPEGEKKPEGAKKP